MKVMCNGFNLYNQLNNPDPLLETFTPVFEEENILNFCINHSFSVLQTTNNCIKLFPNEDIESFKNKIVNITSNDERIFVLDESGKLYKLDLENFSTVKEVPNFIPLDYPEDIVTVLSAGARITVAYTNTGNIFNLPHKLNYGNKKIIDIKCGKEHCLLLDVAGNVLSFGRGSRGQLGHGKIEDEVEPQLIEALAGLKIVRIAAGGWHSCAISKDGDLYTWGWNGNGQLGISRNENEEASLAVMALPTVTDFPDDERNVLMVACGSRHTVALLDNKQLFGTGWNKYKQLKNKQDENYYKFTCLHNFDDEEVIEIKCGPWNTAVLCK